MKIPFDIKYRPQIESGEYKVETRDGRDARIICWDSKAKDARHDTRPIIALVITPIPGLESLIQCGENGILYKDAKDRNDLFIVTPEPELTEFERGIKRGFLCAGLEDVPTGIIKDTAKELLELAKKELCKGCAANLEGYIKGKQETLSDIKNLIDSNLMPGFAGKIIRLIEQNYE